MIDFKTKFKQFAPHLLVFIGFLVVATIFFKPTLDDKVLQQQDMTQVKYMGSEVDKYVEKGQQIPGWTNAMFSGMPTSLIRGAESNNLLYKYYPLAPVHALGYPIEILVVCMLGMYILLICLGVEKILASVAAVGYAFMTYSISSIEAGHITKVLAMGIAPAILGGLYLLYQKKYLPGLVVTGIFLSMQITYMHYQITYYTLIVCGIAGLYFLIDMFMKKEFKSMAAFIGVSFLAIVLAMGANISKLLEVSDYTSQTMRGGSPIEAPAGDKNAVQSKNGGLKMDYAYAWSYGKMESMTFMIPNFVGSSSGKEDGKFVDWVQQQEISEQTGKQLDEVLRAGALHTYFGDLQFTSGPIYIGIIFCFLFILGMMVWKGPFKWVLFGIMCFFLTLGWGRHFPTNEMLFNLLPFYNKFRTPMMAMSMVQILVPLIGFVGLHKFLFGDMDKAEKIKKLKYAVYVTGGILVAFGFLYTFMRGDFLHDFEKLSKQNPNIRPYKGAFNEMASFRKNMILTDTLRSLVYMFASAALLWFFVKGSIKKAWVVSAGMIVLFVADLGGVATRYITEDTYKDKAEVVENVETPSDVEIMKDKSIHRVLDYRQDPFNSSNSAMFHKLIGGYHPAKLSRYQDVISNLITPSIDSNQNSVMGFINNKGLDMLNCKYFLLSPNGQGDTVFSRSTAFGNAWFVNKIVKVSGGKAEMNAVKANELRTEAIVDNKEFKVLPKSEAYTTDSASSIVLDYYHPDTMKYTSNNTNDGFAVFSEVYYRVQKTGWIAMIDGKEVPHFRVDYLLRGLEIPSGSHKVAFVYQKAPKSVTHTAEMVSSMFLYLLLALLIFTALKSKTNSKPVA